MICSHATLNGSDFHLPKCGETYAAADCEKHKKQCVPLAPKRRAVKVRLKNYIPCIQCQDYEVE